jgi:putative tricarboxylic transport membrane protein
MAFDLLNGFSLVLEPYAFMYLVMGVVFGIVVGALPGLTATMAMIVLLPLTFGLPAIASIQLLMGVFVAGITAGSVTAIAISIPGTPASAPTCIEGFQLTRQGRGGEAISVMFITSMLGGIVGAIACITIAPVLAAFALRFGPPEYFLLAVIGMSLVISLSSDSLLKGLISGAIGMAIATVGVDPMSGYPRFSFGISDLEGGVGYGAVIIGLFGLTEVLYVLAKGSATPIVAEIGRLTGSAAGHIRAALSRLPGLRWTIARSSVIGIVVGALPGIGSDVAAWIGYDVEKRFAQKPEEFGKGSLEGMTGCEVANNSEAGGALIPALTFGIPGDPQTVVILGALLLHGIRPGPLLFQQHPEIVWSTFAGLIVAQVVTLILGLMTVRPVLWLISRPVHLLYPAICLFCIIGAFAYSNSLFEVGMMLVLGVFGLVLRLLGYPIVPLVLTYILTPMMESELRRGLVMSHNDFVEFASRPLFLILLAVGVLAFWSAIRVAKRAPQS